MAIKTKLEKKKYGNTEIIFGYAFNEDTPDDVELIYKLNKTKRKIEFSPRKSQFYFFDKILLTGFGDLPDPFNEKGYIRGNTLYYLNTNFKDLNVKNITVTHEGTSQIIKRNKALYIKLNVNLLRSLSDELGSMKFFHNEEKSAYVRKVLNSTFPEVIKKKEVKNPTYKVKHALRMLDSQKVSTFDKADIETIVKLLENLLNSKYKDQIKRTDLFSTTKLRVDEVTLDEIIKQFEDKLANKTSEAQWGNFLGKNLFLIDTKYIHLIPELNLVLAGSRNVDFGLVDTQSYLDIFEIKKPTTNLLMKQTDRGNYVWHPDTIKAVVQAEKYLFNAERKAANLKEDIKSQKGIDLDVIRPRAYLIIGSSTQLDTDAKKQDFRILRGQFKNIEIILYDELLMRLKNQKKRTV